MRNNILLKGSIVEYLVSTVMPFHSRKLVLYLTLMVMLLGACTDVVDINIDPAEDQLVVDAWLNNKSEAQTIRLTLSQPYFSNAFVPAVSDAEVSVTHENGSMFIFTNQGDGDYIWVPEAGGALGEPGDTFQLEIQWKGDVYQAESYMRRVPMIDSIGIEVRDGELGYADGHWAALYARDLPGLGDTYWIKAFKNGVFLNKPLEMNLAYDAAFDAGGEVDGVTFITPIRELINRFPDPDTEDDFETPPYKPGDEVHVEIHSITNAAFFFLQTARDQMNNGENTIFSIPIANTKSNVIRESDGKAVLGFFSVSAVSERTRIVE
ncbi:MAG TPA: DUF4249 domain-containing protein [Saprospiraceae bacterium]|nr:DUF4249 domain-containing protein [Saprospiraceae bacterium]